MQQIEHLLFSTKGMAAINRVADVVQKTASTTLAGAEFDKLLQSVYGDYLNNDNYNSQGKKRDYLLNVDLAARLGKRGTPDNNKFSMDSGDLARIVEHLVLKHGVARLDIPSVKLPLTARVCFDEKPHFVKIEKNDYYYNHCVRFADRKTCERSTEHHECRFYAELSLSPSINIVPVFEKDRPVDFVNTIRANSLWKLTRTKKEGVVHVHELCLVMQYPPYTGVSILSLL